MKKIIYLIIILLIIFICENVYAYDYKVGDKVRYRETIFYIINVDNNANTLTLLKAEPLTVEEVETYSSGIGVPISNQSGYGGMKYHSTSSEYASSYIKKVVDAWAKDKMDSKKVKVSRIATVSEISALGYELNYNGTIFEWKRSNDTPKWVYSENYWYWILSEGEDYAGVMTNYLYIGNHLSINYKGVIRPLVVIYNNEKKAEDDSSDQSESSSEENQNGYQEEYSDAYEGDTFDDYQGENPDIYEEDMYEEDMYEDEDIYDIEDDEDNYDLYDERDISDLYDENDNFDLNDNKTKKKSNVLPLLPIIIIVGGIIITVSITVIVMKKKGAGDKT